MKLTITTGPDRKPQHLLLFDRNHLSGNTYCGSDLGHSGFFSWSGKRPPHLSCPFCDTEAKRLARNSPAFVQPTLDFPTS